MRLLPGNARSTRAQRAANAAKAIWLGLLASLLTACIDVETVVRVRADGSGEVEERHLAVNSRVRDVFFALYRDFPDSFRGFGEEKF